MSLLYFSSADLMFIYQIHDVPLCFGEGLEPSKAFFKRHLRAVGHSWHIVFWKTSQVPGVAWPGLRSCWVHDG